MSTQPPSSGAGVIDGKYQIIRELGRGGMGAVYEARHLGTNRRVAVKVILGQGLESPAALARFQREARATGAVESQHVAVVLDNGIDQASGHPYLVMEFLVGEDLEHVIARVGRLPTDVALRIVAQACVGLEAAHQAGVVHRDLKPANLFLTRRDGGEIVVKLLDFGIAKLTASDLESGERAKLTRTGSMLGSPLYMSPEQATGQKDLDQRTDVWSLGVVLYEMLAGETPHGDAETLGGLILAVCSKPAPPIRERAPGVAPEVEAVVHRALAIERSERFQSVGEMLEAVRGLLPSGAALHESMLSAAASVSLPPGALLAQAPASFAVSARTGAKSSSADPPLAAAASTITPTRARSGGAVAAVVVAASLLVVGGATATYLASRRGTPATAPPVPATALAPTTASASSSAVTVVTPAVAADQRTVQFEVAPANATVEIDGAPVIALNGVVLLKGALGSSHQVRLKLGGRETTAQVVIADSGAVPARVELGAKGTASAPPPPRPSGAAVSAPPPPEPAKTAAPARTAKPTLDRSFND